MRSQGGLAVALFGVVAGCTNVAPLPKTTLPVGQVTHHVVCELKTSFAKYEKPPADLKLPSNFPVGWTASIYIAPKADYDVNGKIGATGNSKGPNSQTFFNSWVLGAAPGAGFDVKANTNGGVTYYVSARDLLYGDIDCDKAEGAHTLTRNLGIEKWLDELVDAYNNSALKGKLKVKFEKPVFTAQVAVRYDGGASFTYNFPFGTNTAAAGGWYGTDETVTIAFTETPAAPKVAIQFPEIEPERKPVRKPAGVQPSVAPAIGLRPYRPGGVSDEAKRRLDQIQTEQLLRSIRPN
jgi:hypothetical protein